MEDDYEISPGKKKVITELKKLAKGARDIWFATDLDREGEAIAWHLAEVLKVNPPDAKRVTFDAITKSDVQKAFENPRGIDMHRVDARARRILDRLVGFLTSPILWPKGAVKVLDVYKVLLHGSLLNAKKKSGPLLLMNLGKFRELFALI